MFNVNLLNKPGEQKTNANDAFVTSNSKSADHDLDDNIMVDPENIDSNNPYINRGIDIFYIIISFLIIAIIISIFLAYYFDKL